MDQIGQLEQFVMLAILRLRSEAYGVALQKELKTRTGREYSVGAIYAVLDKLEGKGFVKSKQGEATPERGGRAKLYFNLTGSGQSALQASLQAIDNLRANTQLVPRGRRAGKSFVLALVAVYLATFRSSVQS